MSLVQVSLSEQNGGWREVEGRSGEARRRQLCRKCYLNPEVTNTSIRLCVVLSWTAGLRLVPFQMFLVSLVDYWYLNSFYGFFWCCCLKLVPSSQVLPILYFL